MFLNFRIHVYLFRKLMSLVLSTIKALHAGEFWCNYRVNVLSINLSLIWCLVYNVLSMYNWLEWNSSSKAKLKESFRTYHILTSIDRSSKCTYVLISWFLRPNMLSGRMYLEFSKILFTIKCVAPIYHSTGTGHPHIICQRVHTKNTTKIIFLDLHQHPQLVAIKQLSKNNTAPKKKEV